MKKVAGTLKLDQAQYRELEAFSKFGSDLDPATMAILDKGRKNVELLKQAQYEPCEVAHQVALIYCGTQGLLSKITIENVQKFEKEFTATLELRHREVLEKIRQGNLDDASSQILTELAKDVCRKFEVIES